jgi:hypothetical protein
MENYSVSLFLPNSMIGLVINSDYKKYGSVVIVVF